MLVEILVFERGWVTFSANLRGNGASPTSSNSVWMSFASVISEVCLGPWISLDLKFVTGQTVTRAELRHRAKFSQNRSNRGRDMAIIRFSRWRRPPSWICKILNF